MRFRPASLLLLPLLALPRPAAAEPPERRDSPEQMAARAAFWHTQRAFPADDIPRGALSRAHEAYRALRRGRKPGQMPTWAPIGPAPLDTSQGTYETPNMSPGAGRASVLALDPTDQSTFYAGYALGGVWKTTDAGVTWTPLMDTADALAVGAILVDPSAPQTVYVGTGEATPYIGYAGQGILKSTDGGASFARIDGTQFDGLSIARLFLDAGDHSMYAAAFFGALGRGQNCNAMEAAKGQGLYRSTDGGATWKLVKDGQIIDLEIDTSVTPRRILVSDYATGAFHSEDGGATWSPAAGLPTAQDMPRGRRIELALSAANPMIVYAGLGLGTAAAVYVSQDGGKSFSPMQGAPDYCGAQCYYDNAVAVDPTQPATVYLGGGICGVWKTDNALDPTPTWINVSLPAGDCGKDDDKWYSGFVHPDVHEITVDPQHPSRVFAVTDGGIAESDDGGVTWQQRNAGVGTIQFYALCAAPDGTLYGGAQDQGIMQHTTAGLTWTGIVAADGGPCFVDPSNPKKVLVSTEEASVAVTTTGFDTTPVYVFDASSNCQPLDPGCGDRTGFIAPLAGDPSAPGTYYVGTYRVWKSDDGGMGWKPASDDLTAGKMTVPCTQVTPKLLDDFLTAITVAPSASSTLYTGSQGGRIFATTDGGAHWNRMDKAPLPARWVTGIAVDPLDARTVYASFSGFAESTPGAPGHVFRSTDGGATWALRDIGMDMPVDALLAHPVAPGLLYAGTDFGVLVTTDGGASWSALGEGLPHVAVYGLAYQKKAGALAAGTYGRSAWTLPFPKGGLSATPPAIDVTVQSGGAAPAPQSIAVTDTDTLGSVVSFTVASDSPWIQVDRASGAVAGAAAVTVKASIAAGQAAGPHTGTLTLTPLGGGAVVSIPVKLVVETSKSSGGCGCRASGADGAPLWPGAAAGAAIVLLRRRRRRAARSRVLSSGR